MLKERSLKKQFSPEDIGDEELKELADRLEGDSDRETLTNVLDWQDRNLSFWWERWPFAISLKILVPIVGLLIFFLSLPFLLLIYGQFPGLFLPFFAGLTLMIIMLVVSRAFFTFIYIFMSLFVMYPVLSFLLRNLEIVPSALQYTLVYGGCLGAVGLIFLYLFIRYRHFLKEDSWIGKASKFIGMVNDTFRSTLPVSKFLEYRLTVCRDYAKITAALLFNLYPDSEIYFFSYWGHLTAGLKLDGKYYILDQRLPVSTKDRWLERRGKEEADVHLLKLKEGGKELALDEQEGLTLSDNEKVAVDTEELAEGVAKDLGIEQSREGDSPDSEITMENHASLYDDDEIVRYSMIRAIKNRLSDELSGNVDKVSRIEIEQDEEDLVLKGFTGK